MARPIKKEKIKDVSKTEEPKIPSVFFVADRELLPKLYSEDLVKIKKAFNVSIDVKNERFTITSDNIDNCRKAVTILEKLFDWFDNDLDIQEEDIDQEIAELLPKPYKDSKYKGIFKTYKGEELSPRTKNQEEIVRNIKNKKITILSGKAGTGKTHISVMMALKFLDDNRYDKIIVIRPMVTVGANGNALGFLPGSEAEKTSPYSQAITQLFVDMIGSFEFEKRVKEEKIVFTSLSLIRGCTFNNAIVILDEAQNTTKHEILTVLTRLNYSTKLIITGDESQKDINDKKSSESGLSCCVKLLKEIEGIGFVEMKIEDIQRDKIIGEIIRAFE